MSVLSVHDIQGINTFGNTVRIPSGHKLSIEGDAILPVLTTSTRPSNPVVGQLIFNTDYDRVEFYTNDGWKPVVMEGKLLSDGPSNITLGTASDDKDGINRLRAVYEKSNRNVTKSHEDSMMGLWPQKHMGKWELRGYTAGGQAGGQYLHIKTNVPCGSVMTFWRAEGYLYGNANMWSRAGAYPYNGTVINIHINNSGSSTIDGIYASSNGGGSNNKMCMRFNRNSTGYSEGWFDLWMSGFNKNNYESYEVTDAVYTDSSSNQF